MATKILMTAKELSSRTEDAAKKWELCRGELIKVSPSGGRHGALTIRVGRLIDEFVSQRNLGIVCGAETGFILFTNPDTVRAPDISFVKRERVPAAGIPDGFWPFAPDLAVEVVSPNESTKTVEAKVQDYLDSGVRLIWVVYPKTQTVTVCTTQDTHTLKPEDTLDGKDVLPGFRCSVADLFS
jgi:Uma2 family endonuclease